LTPAAFLAAVLAVIAADLLDRGSLHALLNLPGMLLVLGGTLGATAMSVDRRDLRQLPQDLRRLLRPDRPPRQGTIEAIGRLAEIVRREGLLRLEDEIAAGGLPKFLSDGVQNIVDGFDESRLRSHLERAIDIEDERRGAVALIFRTAGGFAPTLGIIGTVVGLVSVLSHLGDVNQLAPSIATAFLATLWGIASANLFWLPLGFRLERLQREAHEDEEMMLQGMLGILSGQNPRLLQEQLAVYLEPGRPPKHEPPELRAS
jgi:chemotaxis protein MotA